MTEAEKCGKKEKCPIITWPAMGALLLFPFILTYVYKMSFFQDFV